MATSLSAGGGIKETHIEVGGISETEVTLIDTTHINWRPDMTQLATMGQEWVQAAKDMATVPQPQEVYLGPDGEPIR